MTINDQFRELPAKGTIFLGVKAENTEDNSAVFAAFKDFCYRYCGNDRTVGLRRLLEYYEEDAKYEQLYRYLTILEQRLAELEIAKKEPETKKGSEMF